MTNLTNFLDRKSLLADRTEVTDEILECLCELSEESVNYKSLERFTEKKFRDLSLKEKEELIKNLESADYKKYKNCFISTSKLLYEKSETLIKEIKALNVLSNLGYSVYLLPYGYARNNQDFLQKSADFILNSKFLEFKNVVSIKETAGESAYKDSRKQSNNVFLFYENDIKEDVAIHAIIRYINASKKDLKGKGLNYNYEGEVFFYFGKTGKTKLVEINKEGFVKDKEINSFGMKNIGRAQASPVVELFSEKPHPLPINNITSSNQQVNKNSYESFNKKEKTMENTKKEITAKELQNYIENLKIRHPSKWAEAVKEDAADLVGNYIEWHGEDASFKLENAKDLLNGAKDWKQYSQGGSGLVYDVDIAKRYSSARELKRLGFKDGDGTIKAPNAKESWLDVQARALFQASELVKESVRNMEMKRGKGIEQKSPAKAKAKSKEDDFGMER